jgi:hypothetical protein
MIVYAAGLYAFPITPYLAVGAARLNGSGNKEFSSKAAISTHRRVKRQEAREAE